MAKNVKREKTVHWITHGILFFVWFAFIKKYFWRWWGKKGNPIEKWQCPYSLYLLIQESSYNETDPKWTHKLNKSKKKKFIKYTKDRDWDETTVIHTSKQQNKQPYQMLGMRNASQTKTIDKSKHHKQTKLKMKSIEHRWYPHRRCRCRHRTLNSVMYK